MSLKILTDPTDTAWMLYANCAGVDPETKRCSGCREIKPVAEFYRDKSKRDGLSTQCKVCKKAGSHAAYWSNPEAYRRRRRIGRVNISNLALHAMEHQQRNLCAICREKSETQLHIDHDHRTGQVRALLCSGCNVGLGAFADDPARLRAAAEYIELHRDGEVAS